ncbi:unnamed protein product [Dimorphilus gyrociliatus]|uniref:G-protein coupled receptors family 1 profile domain-containing protein n=1 Tax=Dimorphilus gyrociliatus TaxID=2664684 RepID=A0A7I8W692_9ANNE|nr:unnamed protein product [Dimorphilus gyrociliatus]
METNTTLTNESVFERYSVSEFSEIFIPNAVKVDRIVSPIWYSIGIIGNLLSTYVWLQKRMRKKNSSAVYLITLAISDLTFLPLHLLMELKHAWGYPTIDYPIFCELFNFIYLVPQCLSPLLVLGFTVERWIAICRPFKKQQYCNTGRAIKVVIGSIVGASLICSMQAYLWQYKNGLCEARQETSQGSLSLFTIWTSITETIIFGLVPIVILIFNLLVVREIRLLASNQIMGGSNHSTATTLMLLSVSFYVIATTLPVSILYILGSVIEGGDIHLSDQQIRSDPMWQSYFKFLMVKKVVDEVCMSHYACNIFIYLITGAKFRQILLKRFNIKDRSDTYFQVSQKISATTAI